MFDFLNNMNLQDIINLFISVGLFLIAGSLHEFSHAFSAYILGDDTARNSGRLTLNPGAHIDIFGSLIFPVIGGLTGMPIFGWMRPVPVNPYNFNNASRGQAITAFAGPFSNFLQASVALILLKTNYYLYGLIGINQFLIYLHYFIFIYLRINITLMIFNLIPAPPLDGGWILRHFLPDRFKMAFDSFYRYGMIFLYALLLTGLLGFILNPFWDFSYYLYINISSINILLVFLPLLSGIIILYLFLRKEIAVFVKRERFKSQVKEGEKEKTKIEQKNINTNNVYVDSAKTIINKIKNKETLSENEVNLVDKMEKTKKNNTNLCEESDFNEDDTHCRECENFLDCLFRKINSIIQISKN